MLLQHPQDFTEETLLMTKNTMYRVLHNKHRQIMKAWHRVSTKYCERFSSY